MSISNQQICLGQIIEVKGHCFGIVYNDGNLLVTFVKPAKVELISMSGDVLRVIDKGTKGEPLFEHPLYIALSPDNTHFNISDLVFDDEFDYNNKNHVTCMALDGEVKGVYSFYSWEDKPCGVTVDKTGSVNVVGGGYGSSYIYQISSDYSQDQELQISTQCPMWPFSIAYCHKEDKLYVGERSCTIKVFQLK